MRFLAIAVILFSVSAWAQTTEATTEPSQGPTAKSSHEQEKTEDKISITHHSVTIGGTKVDYEALAGTILMKDDDGKPRANFFFVAYLKEKHIF